MHKRIVLALSAVTVVAAMAIGGTLAFMTNQTDTKTNTFVAAKGLSGELREPTWDGYQFGDLVDGKEPDGTQAKSNSADLGINKSAKVSPNLLIPKDPQLKNTSSDMPVYMAVKVTYGFKKGTAFSANKTKFDTYAEIQNDSGANSPNSGWIKASSNADGSEIYVYVGSNSDNSLKQVDSQGVTNALFKDVYIKSTATNDDFEALAGETGLGNPTIQIVGGEVQAENITNAQATTELTNLLNK